MKGIVTISNRMKAIADMVQKGNRICDVGCDHCFIPIYLIQTGKAPGALAMDIHDGPLLRAKAHIEEEQLTDYIKLRKSDGLLAYRQGEADTLIIAGMGGNLILTILQAFPEKTQDFKELILSPQSEVYEFRKSMRKLGYQIVKEDMVFEDGKFYPIIKACRAKGDLGEEVSLLDRFGPMLLPERHPILYEYLRREQSINEELLSKLTAAEGERADRRREELMEERNYLKQALAYYQ